MKHDVSNKISETVADYSVSHRQIARAAGVSHSTISRASKAGYMVTKPVRDAIDCGCNKLSMYTPTAVIAANLEKQVEQLRDTINGSGLVDDAIESAHSREKAELQKALAERVDQLAEARLSAAKKDDQLAYLRTEIKRLNAMLEHSNAQSQSSLAALTKLEKRIACQSENIDTLQQQLSAERVSYNDTLERLQSDFDLMQHEYAKAQKTITNKDLFIETLHRDKIDLSYLPERLQSRAEVFKITAFTCGALWLVTLFCLIVILVG